MHRWTTSACGCLGESPLDRHRNAYLYSYANGELNPAWIRHMNGQLASNLRENERQFAEQSARSAAAHQQRMQAIAARGAAATAAGKTYSDVLDISHQGFLNRSNINDAGHARAIDAISETALIGNHETGEHYSVPAGANYYWVSGGAPTLVPITPCLTPIPTSARTIRSGRNLRWNGDRAPARRRIRVALLASNPLL